MTIRKALFVSAFTFAVIMYGIPAMAYIIQLTGGTM